MTLVKTHPIPQLRLALKHSDFSQSSSNQTTRIIKTHRITQQDLALNHNDFSQNLSNNTTTVNLVETHPMTQRRVLYYNDFGGGGEKLNTK